jgi:lysyl-tRNA synthetase class 2
MELCNAFTELNDPLDQEARFRKWAALTRAKTNSATPWTRTICAPCATACLPAVGLAWASTAWSCCSTDRQTIREVILFPHLRKAEEE